MIVANLPFTYIEAENMVKKCEFDAWILIKNLDGVDLNAINHLRNALFFKYQKQARAISQYFKDRLPYAPLVDRDDVESEAYVGLMEAIYSFEYDLGNKFITHAWSRIRGQIVDGQRKLSNLPRIISKGRRELEPVIQELSHRFRRKVTYEEIKDHYPELMIGGMLGFKASTILSDPLLKASVFNQLKTGSEEGSSFNEIEHVFSKSRSSTGSESDLSKRENIEELLLLFSIGTIYEQQRRSVFYLYYFCGFTVTKISKMKRRSTSWVSSLKKDAENYLRQHPNIKSILCRE